MAAEQIAAPTVSLADGRTVRLGRIRPKAPPVALQFAAYYDPYMDAQPPPQVVDWTGKAMDSIRRVYLNDRYGDCVIAGKYHAVGVWSGSKTGTPVLGTDQEVLQQYHSICGPGDNGCNITEVLDVFRSRGLPFNGKTHKIDGYLAVDHGNKTLVQVALQLFGALCLGVNLPGDWTCTNCTWGQPRKGIVGGHDVTAVGYDQTGVKVATWGGICTIVWEAFLSRRWVEECYIMLAPDWYGSDNLAPNGVNVARLREDLDKIQGGQLPDWQPDVPPVPPIPPVPPVPGQSALLTVLQDMPKGSYAVEPLTAPRMPGGSMSVTWIDWLRQIIALLDDLLNKHAAEQKGKERITV